MTFVQIHVCCPLALFAAGCFENNRGVSAKIPTQGGNKLLFKNNKNNNISLPKKKQTFKIPQMKKLISRLFLGELISISLCSKNDNSTSFPTIYENFDTDQLGVNTLDIPRGLALAVNRKTDTEEVLVQVKSTRPDCVFSKDYPLPTLAQVETFIQEKGHLENIPSAKEVQENGILLGDMHAKLLQKIEELTLYAISQEKKIEALEYEREKNNELEKRLENGGIF